MQSERLALPAVNLHMYLHVCLAQHVIDAKPEQLSVYVCR